VSYLFKHFGNCGKVKNGVDVGSFIEQISSFVDMSHRSFPEHSVVTINMGIVWDIVHCVLLE